MRDITYGSFVFDGLIADRHRLPARHLGPALIGLDKIVSSLLLALETGKVQRRSPRGEPKLILTVNEPRKGSYDLGWVAEIAPALLPLFPAFSDAIQAKLIDNFVNYVMMWFGGRRGEANEIMEKMLEIIAAEQIRQHADRQHEREAFYADAERQRATIRALLHDQAEALHAAARQSITPVGHSASSFAVSPKDGHGYSVDTATADAIREKSPVEVSEILSMTFWVDGLRDQTKIMWVYDPEDPEGKRIFPVSIVDPAFEAPGNNYKTAYSESRQITLTGKTTRLADGMIKTFHAVDSTLV